MKVVQVDDVGMLYHLQDSDLLIQPISLRLLKPLEFDLVPCHLYPVLVVVAFENCLISATPQALFVLYTCHSVVIGVVGEAHPREPAIQDGLDKRVSAHGVPLH